jgi:transporter family-2 protein
MEALAVPFLLAVGSLLALQAAANVQLATALASPFGASALQLGIGAGILLALAAAAGALGVFGALADAEPWTLAGGLGSALYITAGILLFPRVGAVAAVGLFIAGQLLASVLLDGFGWLGVERDQPGGVTLAGAGAAVAGIALVVRAQGGARAVRASWVALGLAAGAVLPVQGALNAALRAEIGEPIAVAAFSFLVATAAMALVLAATHAPAPRLAAARGAAQRPSGGGALRRAAGGGAAPRVEALRAIPWWGWLGGACGATYVTSMFLLIPEIGAAPTVALTVAGQQLASVLVDRHGLLRLPRRPITPHRLAGVATLLAGVALVTVGG